MKIGIGSADITPSIGMRTELFQNLKVDRIVTPLLLKVCLFENNGEKSAVVSADVMDFFDDSGSDIRNIISSIAGVPRKNIFMNSSHTHTAPYIYPSAQKYLEPFGTGFLDLEYYDFLLKGVELAALEALKNLETVVVKHSRGKVEGVTSNRRLRMEDGSIEPRYGRGATPKLVAYPDGLIDPYVECLWFENMKGQVKYSILNYACHGTSYGQDTHICWDYMGFARSMVEEKTGAQAMFLQGCCGNLGPGKYTVHEPLEDAVLLGTRLAEAVLACYSEAKVMESGEMKVFNHEIILKGRTTLGYDELKKKLGDEIIRVKQEQEKNMEGSQGAMIISYLERLLMLEKYPDLNIPSEIGLVKIGDIHMFFFPSECFIQYALKLKEQLAGKPVLVMSYTDCTLQYIPDSQAYEDRGGYETDPDWCYSEKGNGEKLVAEALRMIDLYKD